MALANAFYYLAKHPTVYKKLQSELDATFSKGTQTSEFNSEALRRLPYLEAVINETLRLKPAVPSGQPRETPPQGLQVDEMWIPGNTIVVVPQHVIQRDDRYFPSGADFIPERWLDAKDKMITNEEAFFPFQIGKVSIDKIRKIKLIVLRSLRLRREAAGSYGDAACDSTNCVRVRSLICARRDWRGI